MLVDANRLLDDLDLLDCFWCFVTRQQGTSADGAVAEVVLPRVVEHLWRKLRTLVFRMARLPAVPWFGSIRMGVEQRKTKSVMVPPQIAFLSIGLDSVRFSKPR